MADELVVTVDGKPRTIRAAPDTPLLCVLRGELGLSGPQFGCGQEQCGACMVLVGAKAVQSCHLPVSEVGRAAVTTLEGLSVEGELHPVQRAFVDEQAAQCGYCLNGMIITTAALLWKTPRPNDTQIRAALDGNLCRCGARLRILRAVRASVFGQGTTQLDGWLAVERDGTITAYSGARLRQVPFTPGRVRAALAARPSPAA